MGELAAAQAAKLDQLGVPAGGRVAFVSQNSARLLTSFFGVSGYGRVLVPINFRLSLAEIRYIVEHSGAEVVYVDPEQQEDPRRARTCRTSSSWARTTTLYLPDTEPRPWDEPDEDATATINYTSGTTARPKGVQLTHRNNWLNATVFGLHTTISDRDVYLHTLPMFHANGWGMPFGITGVGAQHVVLRKVDGTEILRRVERHGVTIMCAAPAVISAALDGAQSWDGEIPGRDRVRIIAAGAPPPTRTIERVLDELGWEFIQIYGLTETSPLVTVNRSRAEWDGLSTHERATRLGRAGAPALGVRVTDRCRRRGADAVQPQPRGLLGAAGRDGRGAAGQLVPHRRRRSDRRRQLPGHLRPQEGRDHLRRRERLVHRGRGRPDVARRGQGGRGHRHPGREVGRAGHGAGGHRRQRGQRRRS